MIEYSTGRVEFERHQDKTLTAEFDGHWLYVKRARKNARYFLGFIDGEMKVTAHTEKEAVHFVVTILSGW